MEKFKKSIMITYRDGIGELHMIDYWKCEILSCQNMLYIENCCTYENIRKVVIQ